MSGGPSDPQVHSLFRRNVQTVVWRRHILVEWEPLLLLLLLLLLFFFFFFFSLSLAVKVISSRNACGERERERERERESSDFYRRKFFEHFTVSQSWTHYRSVRTIFFISTFKNKKKECFWSFFVCFVHILASMKSRLNFECQGYYNSYNLASRRVRRWRRLNGNNPYPIAGHLGLTGTCWQMRSRLWRWWRSPLWKED